jgi:hypothetical protein
MRPATPALAAADSPQVWFAGSAPHETSVVLRRLLLRAREGTAERLVAHEWCAPDDAELDDVKAWRSANPALGRRLTEGFTRSELDALDPEDFRRERLGIWLPELFGGVIPAALWRALSDPSARAMRAKVIAVDVTPDRRRSVIAAGGRMDDDRIMVEVLDEREGVSWVVDEVAAVVAEHEPAAVVVDGAGQSQTLIAPLEKAGVEVTRTGPAEMAAACGGFHDAVMERTLLHMGQGALDAAVEGSKQRTLGDAWAWSRRSSRSNVAPLVAVSLAHYGVVVYGDVPALGYVF